MFKTRRGILSGKKQEKKQEKRRAESDDMNDIDNDSQEQVTNFYRH